LDDVSLRYRLEDFIYSTYLPSLYNYISDQDDMQGIKQLWPGDQRISSYYSAADRAEWEHVLRGLLFLVQEPRSPWDSVKSRMDELKIPTTDIEEKILASMIRGQIHQLHEIGWVQWTAAMLNFFSYSYGASNFLLYVAFPFMLLLMLITGWTNFMLYYVEFFIWIKSWIITSALAHYVSLVAAAMLSRASADSSWFWESPYHVLIAALLLYLLPVGSFILINQSFQTLRRSL
jgi:hypothetical protein